MSTPQNETLKRTLGMREAVTITVGTVVGVGLFTTGAQIVGSMGSAVILATFMAMVISVYPSHLYAEMSAALPFAGGTYKYAQLGLGKAAGMLAGWNFIASLVAVTSGEALAFSFYFKTLFRAFGVELPISDVLLAAIPIEHPRHRNDGPPPKRLHVLLLGRCHYLGSDDDPQHSSSLLYGVAREYERSLRLELYRHGRHDLVVLRRF